MEALTLRMNGMKTTIADMMIKMNAYVIKTDGMMTAVETNDTALKTTVEVVKGTLETKNNGIAIISKPSNRRCSGNTARTTSSTQRGNVCKREWN